MNQLESLELFHQHSDPDDPIKLWNTGLIWYNTYS